jgi:murein DD-endopeptidase MepM/ murein hydrolase activator NlpD
LLAACSPAAAQTAAPPAQPSDTPFAPESSPTAQLATLTLGPTASPMPTETRPPLPTATAGAIQLFFPTYIPAEGAEYRPPLYPIPWALTAHDHFFFARPISATYPADPYADYTYGSIYFGPDSIHTGVDMPAPRGTDVMAAGPGTVVWSGIGLYSGSRYNVHDPYGIAVAIRHDFGYEDQPLFTIYAHLNDTFTAVGQWVNTGDVIGYVGSTGLTTGPHLHFEVRLGANDFWSTRNPELWMAPPLGYGVLAGRVMNTAGFLMDSQLVTVTSLDTQRSWYTYTYAKLTIHRDSYFDENVVIGSLPAGTYELNIPYGALNRKVTFQILAGQINSFSFQGRLGYQFGEAALPTPTPVP